MNRYIVFLFLLLNCKAFSKDYTGAEIRTKESFLYGRFEVKMKSCQASGMLMSFFTFYDDPSFVSNWNEIDIEILGRYTNEVQFNAIVGNHEMHEKRQVLNFNPHQDFHVYSFDWTPEYIAWSVDGQEVYKQTGEHISKMDKAQKIMMNIWPSEFWDWTGPWDESKLPVSAMYDYVKYYEYQSAKPEKFKLSWEDHFNSIDYSRWDFATHTFDGNACVFDPSNASVKGGYLLLKLSKSASVSLEEQANDFKKGDPEIIHAGITKKGKIKVVFKSPIELEDGKKENFTVDGMSAVKSYVWMDRMTVELTLAEPAAASKELLLKYVSPGKSIQEIKIVK